MLLCKTFVTTFVTHSDGSSYFLLGIHVLELFVVVKVSGKTVTGTNGEEGKCYFYVLEL